MSGVNAFQSNAFQQTFGLVAFQEAIVVTSGGGDLLDDYPYKHWRKKDIRHLAAVHLGRKGGITFAINHKYRKP